MSMSAVQGKKGHYYRFSEHGIPLYARLYLKIRGVVSQTIFCTVCSDTQVNFQGHTMSLTAAAKAYLQSGIIHDGVPLRYSELSGPQYWCYNGVPLSPHRVHRAEAI